jgi:DNA-directed RNA polymerase specialized sigma24 family protein
VTDDATLRELINWHHRRLYMFLRSLLPAAAETEAALRTTERQIWDRARDVRPEKFVETANGIARRVAAERRRTPGSFSEDLFRQLADFEGPSLEVIEKRRAALGEVLEQLPPPERDLLRRKYELGMTPEQIALSENRPVKSVNRDLVGLHASVVAALRERVPDRDPEPPGGAGDLGRLTDQLLDGTITEDGRLVLETLLLADAAAQAHYHRHVALVAELTLRFRGVPPVPEPPVPSPRVSRREQVVTWAFVAACVVVFLFLILLFTGLLR